MGQGFEVGASRLRALKALGPRHGAAAALRHTADRLGGEDTRHALPAVVLRCEFASKGPRVQPAATPWPARVAIVIPPYTRGAGGHGNIFRLANQLVDAGASVAIHVSDVAQGPLSEQQALIGELVSGRVVITSWTGSVAADIVVATSWMTAYDVYEGAPLSARTAYFVQDLESLFYPASGLSLLAALTYRFGFDTMTLGALLRDELARRFGVTARVVDFGYDGGTYHLPGQEEAPRAGVVFYGRDGTPRRCVDVGLQALVALRERRPDVPIRVVGRPSNSRPLPSGFEDLGVLSPADLARLYQRSTAALVLSASNTSLMPLELMACGVAVVVNDEWPLPAAVDPASYVRGPLLPRSLAAGLERAVGPERPQPKDIASAVSGLDYRTLPPQFAEALRQLCS